MSLQGLHRYPRFQTNGIVLVFAGVDLADDFFELVQGKGLVEADR
jgi:hypothetical protein